MTPEDQRAPEAQSASCPPSLLPAHPRDPGHPLDASGPSLPSNHRYGSLICIPDVLLQLPSPLPLFTLCFCSHAPPLSHVPAPRVCSFFVIIYTGGCCGPVSLHFLQWREGPGRRGHCCQECALAHLPAIVCARGMALLVGGRSIAWGHRREVVGMGRVPITSLSCSR